MAVFRYERSWLTDEEPTQRYLNNELLRTKEQVNSLGLDYLKLEMTITAELEPQSFWQVLFRCPQRWLIKVTAKEATAKAPITRPAEGEKYE